MNEQQIPGIQSWIRVNPRNEEDVRNAVEMVPDEDRAFVGETMMSHAELSNTRLVVFIKDELTHILSENVFEAMYLSPDEGVDEAAPVENGEISLFELGSDSERGMLAQWAATVLPGVDLVSLQSRVNPGNLVLHRPGAIGFEVFGPVDYAATEKSNMRAMMLDLAIRSEGSDKRQVLEIAKEYESWVL